MLPFRYHVFVCDQPKPEGVPSCRARCAGQVIDALRREIGVRKLEDRVQITTCGSLGLCERGPNMVVYPEGVWYSGVTPADVSELVASHFENGQPLARLARTDVEEVRAEMASNREKRLAAMRAQEAAGALPDDLNDLIRGFQESRVILTALELEVFTAIGEGATAGEIAGKIGANPRATEMLLHALASQGLVSKRDGMFHNKPVAARYFAASSPDNARPALMHMAHLWKNWSTLTDCVRAGTSASHDEMADRPSEWTNAFIAAMHRNASARSGLVVRAVGAENVRQMLDIGGGSGAYSIAFAQANPELQAHILDLPTVAPLAARYIEQAGVAGRIHVRAGNMLTDHLGEGYDLVFASAICHMFDVKENAGLIRRAFGALVPGGRMAIQEFILNEDKTGPKMAALFSLNMLVGTRAGASYSEPEYAEWMRAAGFVDVRRITLPGPTGIMIGTRL